MSHFTVGVISKDLESLERLLAPYQENNMGDCPKEYLKFESKTEECRKNYEEGFVDRIKLADGTFVHLYDNILYCEISKAEYDELKKTSSELVKEEYRHGWKYYRHKDLAEIGAELVTLPLTALYRTFEQYMDEYECINFDAEMNDYGYWENPNAKWDWWQVGGRFRGSILLKNGSRVDSAKIKDICFTPDFSQYKEAIRYWDIAVNGAEPTEEEKKKFCLMYKPNYYLSRFKTAENYAKIQSSIYPYAFITDDGEWHERGSMGWFACDDATSDSISELCSAFDKAISEVPEDYWLTFVDCHI